MQIKKIFPPLLIVVSTMANYCRSIEDFQGRHYIEGEQALQKGDKEDKQALQRDVIRITDLGEFEVSNEYEKPLEQKVKNRLQKLCPGLKLDWITFSVQPFLKQIDILPNSLGSKFYTGRVTLTYTPLVINDSQYIKTHEYKKNLSDIITSYYLGEFDVTNKYAKPSEREVKEMLVKLYPGLNTKEIEVHVYPFLGKIDIFGKGLYTGHVTLRYTQQAKTKRLSDIITSCYLGEFGEKPSGDELLNRLEQLCPSLNMNWIRVLRSSTLEQIVILPNELGSKFYTGRVTLTYTTLKTNHSQDPRLEEAYKILGVDENTPYDQIRKAYHKLALKYHPDKHPDASEEEKEKYNNLFNQLKKAWDFVEGH